MKNKWRKITGIILTLLIVAGIVFAGIKYIPAIYIHIFQRRQEIKRQENEKTLNVYELDYGKDIYLITSANYSSYYNRSGVMLTFYPDYKSDDIGRIWFIVNDEPAKVKIIKTFKSKEDTTSFVKIK